MSYSTIEFEKKDNIGFLFLNRPEVLNALSEKMGEELADCLSRAAFDNDIKTMVLSGRGKAFSAGADLEMFKQRYESFRENGQPESTQRAELPSAFINFPKPLIAAINGAAVGFGITMPLNCDIRIASSKAKFSFAFARVGVTPEFGSSYFLPRMVGYGKAAELVFTAKMFDAAEALDMGLVNKVTEPDELLSEAENMARQIADLPASAIREAKKLLRHGYQSTIEQVLDYEALVFQHASQDHEHYEAVCRIKEELKKKSSGK
ncbi:MAG: enoyl-CoA hydratase/isomerase family protein [Desulfobacteraceae bacterium]|nr:enoyl-CoA hydratase/isomerase family protein [Desulfobacteraceae bacterium]